MFHTPQGIGSGRHADLIVVLDGGSARLEYAERFRQQTLQDHPRPGRSLELVHLLFRCSRASTPPPRSPPSPIGCATSPRPALPGCGLPPIPITPPEP